LSNQRRTRFEREQFKLIDFSCFLGAIIDVRPIWPVLPALVNTAIGHDRRPARPAIAPSTSADFSTISDFASR